MRKEFDQNTMVFGPKLKIRISVKKDTMQNHILRAAEWRIFQLQTHLPIWSKRTTNNDINFALYSSWFSAIIGKGISRGAEWQLHI